MLLAQVIVPLSLSGDFTYIVPDHLANTLQNGMRVEVQFGAKRVYAGIVKHLYNGEIPANLTLKTISNILDDRPIVPPNALRLWQWV
ncbi:MAG TPA: primosomal protein N', partial [Chitinophagales bacterium]|nr:primosomal protein N' [Chitinophagales bacterium]